MRLTAKTDQNQRPKTVITTPVTEETCEIPAKDTYARRRAGPVKNIGNDLPFARGKQERSYF